MKKLNEDEKITEIINYIIKNISHNKFLILLIVLIYFSLLQPDSFNIKEYLAALGTLVNYIDNKLNKFPSWVIYSTFFTSTIFFIYGFIGLYKKIISKKLYKEIECNYLINISKKDVKQLDIANKTIQQRAKILQEHNLQSSFILKKVQFRNAGILGSIRWHPSPGINIILGRNGYGKSYFLRLIIGLLCYDNGRLSNLVGRIDNDFQMRIDILRDGAPTIIEHDGIAFDESTGGVPVLAIPDARFINRGAKSFAADEGDFADLGRHGAHHFLYDKYYESTIQTVLAQICIEAIGAKGEDVKYPSSPQIELISKIIFALSGERFVFQQIKAVGSGRFEIIVETEASPDHPISLQQASQGTMSIIAIFGLIYQFLQKLPLNAPGNKVFDKIAIVLIDEVDAHLHPAWQRKIVMLLRRTFPNVQFILTAHSPLVVAGCSYGEITVLKLQNKKIELVEYQEDFIGTPIEKIYDELFDIGDRDDAFLELYSQLPLVKELQAQLELEQNSRNPNPIIIKRAQAHLDKIQKAQSREEQELELEMLTRENKQLRRQLDALQQSTEKLS